MDALGVLAGLWEGSRVVRDKEIEFIHARSYIPAAIALGHEQLTGVPSIFDMRGFSVDERADGGLWGREGIFHPVGKGLETKALRFAAVSTWLRRSSDIPNVYCRPTRLQEDNQ